MFATLAKLFWPTVITALVIYANLTGWQFIVDALSIIGR